VAEGLRHGSETDRDYPAAGLAQILSANHPSAELRQTVLTLDQRPKGFFKF
jgi:hypothetical protein